MINLLYITNKINGSGGLERVLSVKTGHLIDEYNYNIHIATLKNGYIDPFYSFNNKIDFHKIEPKTNNSITYFFSYFKQINALIEKVKPSIILVCDDGIKAFFAPVFLKKKIPLIYERHASINLIRKSDSKSFSNMVRFKFTKFIMVTFARLYNKFIVLTQNNLNEWKLKNATVIPNPLSFYPEEASNLKRKVIITVANHGYHKGIDRLLNSWSQIHKSLPNWELKIFGLKDKNRTFEKMASNLNIDNSVSFFNPTEDIQNEYLNASIYALPSRSEGFGMVLIEAMACGLPCVSFDCPSGPRDIVTHKKDGFLIDNDDIDGFSDKLCELALNNELREKMGKNAREKAKLYLPKNIICQWDNLFKSLLNHTS